MAPLLKIAEWNANGLCQRAQEIQTFIQNFNMKHHEPAKYRLNNMQATSVTREDSTGQVTRAPMYCPPRYYNKYAMHWLIGRKSELSTENKLLVYKTILKPIWTYGASLWGTASTSNIEMLQRFQNKVLRAIVNAPRYVPNRLLHADLGTPTVREETTNISRKYQYKITAHPNELAATLLDNTDEPRRLKTDLTTRFT
ncbi:hypothetical protein B7P43_G17039 [Cryptotermes secundus]|uniref:Uncharacterized protein n=1 Tax=Cryptotermes secundus TaxID=105785 RepID=A0A2J7RKH8_9NEOP|nr:hypothetical protein B7P43_G17039 [Cryptotermes secundus]